MYHRDARAIGRTLAEKSQCPRCGGFSVNMQRHMREKHPEPRAAAAAAATEDVIDLSMSSSADDAGGAGAPVSLLFFPSDDAEDGADRGSHPERTGDLAQPGHQVAAPPLEDIFAAGFSAHEILAIMDAHASELARDRAAVLHWGELEAREREATADRDRIQALLAAAQQTLDAVRQERMAIVDDPGLLDRCISRYATGHPSHAHAHGQAHPGHADPAGNAEDGEHTQ